MAAAYYRASTHSRPSVILLSWGLAFVEYCLAVHLEPGLGFYADRRRAFFVFHKW
jgi:uncharacterized protein (DUF486 family)